MHAFLFLTGVLEMATNMRRTPTQAWQGARLAPSTHSGMGKPLPRLDVICLLLLAGLAGVGAVFLWKAIAEIGWALVAGAFCAFLLVMAFVARLQPRLYARGGGTPSMDPRRSAFRVGET